jgi:hypothetical protein
MLRVPKIRYPGATLRGDPSEPIVALISFLEASVVDASIALHLFEQHAADEPALKAEDRLEREQLIRDTIDQELSNALSPASQDYADRSHLYAVRSIERGILPQSYVLRFAFVHAHSFLYALASFERDLESLRAFPQTKEAAKVALAELDRALPSIRKIRNSAAHADDRIQGYGSPGAKKRGEQMNAANGMLLVSVLRNNTLEYTVDDGTVQGITVSEEAIVDLVAILNDFLASIEWTGPRRIAPQ